MEREDFKPGVWFTLRRGDSHYDWKVVKELGEGRVLLESHRKDSTRLSVLCEWTINTPGEFIVIHTQTPETNSITGLNTIEEEQAFQKRRDDIFRTLFE